MIYGVLFSETEGTGSKVWHQGCAWFSKETHKSWEVGTDFQFSVCMCVCVLTYLHFFLHTHTTGACTHTPQACALHRYTHTHQTGYSCVCTNATERNCPCKQTVRQTERFLCFAQCVELEGKKTKTCVFKAVCFIRNWGDLVFMELNNKNFN